LERGIAASKTREAALAVQIEAKRKQAGVGWAQAIFEKEQAKSLEHIIAEFKT